VQWISSDRLHSKLAKGGTDAGADRLGKLKSTLGMEGNEVVRRNLLPGNSEPHVRKTQVIIRR
jgi:hypothetical protein